MVVFFLVISLIMLTAYTVVYFSTFAAPVVVLHVLYPLPILCVIMKLEELFGRKKKWALTEPYWYAAYMGFFIYLQVNLCIRMNDFYSTGALPLTPQFEYVEALKWAVIGIMGGGVLVWISIKLDDWHEERIWRKEREEKKEKQKMEIKARIEAGEENLRAYYQSLCADTDRKSRFRYV